jgi:hypothetical protein
MPKVEVSEIIAFDAADVRTTKEGYLVAMPRVARSGIQIYRGDEMGRPDLATVRVYRPEKEVFSRDAVASYAHRPVTNGHPPVPVTADNWKQYAAGQTGDETVRDGQFVRVPMVLMDAAAIKDFRDGKRELSQGYAMDLHWEAGKTEDGEDYDAVMKTIRQNHLALVKRARGGPQLRIGDANSQDWRMAFDQFCDDFLKKASHGEDEMELKTAKIQVGDQLVDVVDVSAQHILRTISGLEGELTTLRSKMEKDKEDAKKARDEAIAAAKTTNDAVIATKDAEITTLKDQLEKAKIRPETLDAMVVERVNAVTSAKALLGDKAPDFSGKSVGDIRRIAVDSLLGEKAKGWSDDAVKASFDTLASQVKTTNDGVNDPIRQTFRSGTSNVNDSGKAYDSYVSNLSDAWKGKPAN